jgi:Ras-related protein Rab-5C
MLITLVGNKIDVQQEDRVVPQEEVEIYAKEFDLLYIETSAKLGTNIGQVFTEIGK